jgi:protein associated with RNAse G/E
MTEPEQITVRVLKYDGAEHRRWRAVLSQRDESLLVLDAQFKDEVEHDLLGRIGRGTRTIEYYWLDRWYNVFRFLETDGSTRLYYCNVNMPPVLSDGTLTYIDLDIDIFVQPNFSYQVLDLEEFEANAARFEYPEQVKAEAHAAVNELITLIETRQYPFS